MVKDCTWKNEWVIIDWEETLHSIYQILSNLMGRVEVLTFERENVRARTIKIVFTNGSFVTVFFNLTPSSIVTITSRVSHSKKRKPGKVGDVRRTWSWSRHFNYPNFYVFLSVFYCTENIKRTGTRVAPVPSSLPCLLCSALTTRREQSIAEQSALSPTTF